MTDNRREQLSRFNPTMGSYLTLTIVLLASLTPYPAAADLLDDWSSSAPAVRRSAGYEPVLLGGLVIGHPGCTLAPRPEPTTLRTEYGSRAVAVAPPGHTGPDPRLTPVRGP